jgi:hypothetical protein
MTLARIIRLGFPEWTLWALPLAAHEFGHVVVGNNPTLQQFIENKASDEVDRYRLQEYLADAFATYAMGPAYIYAAVLLHLDPLTAYEDAGKRPASAKRAHVMFAMLKRMDENASIESPYGEVIETLQEEWLATLHQVSQHDSLNDQDEKQLNSLVDYIGHFLDVSSVVAYRHEAWIASETWQNALFDDEVGQLEVRGDEELRDVLNAAWACRVKYQTGPQGVDKIQRAARELWDQIRSQRQEHGDGGVFGWRI